MKLRMHGIFSMSPTEQVMSQKEKLPAMTTQEAYSGQCRLKRGWKALAGLTRIWVLCCSLTKIRSYGKVNRPSRALTPTWSVTPGLRCPMVTIMFRVAIGRPEWRFPRILKAPGHGCRAVLCSKCHKIKYLLNSSISYVATRCTDLTPTILWII